VSQKTTPVPNMMRSDQIASSTTFLTLNFCTWSDSICCQCGLLWYQLFTSRVEI